MGLGRLQLSEIAVRDKSKNTKKKGRREAEHLGSFMALVYVAQLHHVYGNAHYRLAEGVTVRLSKYYSAR